MREMTNFKRLSEILIGILGIAFAVALYLYPDKGLPFVIGVIGFGLTLKGLGTLLFYFRSARFMVGGKAVLYQGIIFLDLGLFSSSISNNPGVVIIIYLAAFNLFDAVVQVMRLIETIRMGSSHWKLTVLSAVLSLAIAVMVVVEGIVLDNLNAAVYAYAFGLIISSINRIRNAFRRTAIVYIQ